MNKHLFYRQIHILSTVIALLILFTLITGTSHNQAHADYAQQTPPPPIIPLVPPDPAPNAAQIDNTLPIQQQIDPLVPPDPAPNASQIDNTLPIQQQIDPLVPPDPAPNTPQLDGTPPVQRQPAALLSVVGGTWLPQGPGPSYNGQVEGLINSEVAGAIHTVAAHPSNADILYAGAVNGGIWKTTNATAVNPNWVAQTDDKASLSIGALEFDPTDGTNNTLVAGIGRYSSFAQRGGYRTGILRTTDGGTTWTEINGGGTLTGKNISGAAPRGSTIVVSINAVDNSNSCNDFGLFRSTDTGATFSQVGPRGVAFDLASDPTNSATLYAGLIYASVCSGGVLNNGIYKSSDTGANWTEISNAAMRSLIIDSATNNIEIAAHGLNIFVNIIQNGQSAGIFYSSDGGTSWTPMDLPLMPIGSLGVISNVTPGSPIIITTSAAHNLSTGNEVKITNVTGTTGANGVHTITVTGATTFQLNNSSDVTAWGGSGNWQKVVGMNPKVKPGGQGGIHASIRIDPANPTTVYVGGDRQDYPFPNYIGANNFTGSLFRGDPSIGATGGAPSPQWDHLTHSDVVVTIPNGGTASSSAPHADSREIVFDADGDIIEVDDGGIYRRTSPQDNTGDWFSLNGDIQVTEIHNVTYDNLSNVIISGNQDTGTTYQTTVGHPTWNSLSTGDGGDVAVDNIVLAGSNQSVRYSSFQRFENFRRTVWNADGTLAGTSFPALTVTSGAPLASQFTTPVVTNGVAGSRLLIGGGNSLYESTDGGTTITEIAPGLVVNSGNSGHIMAYGAAGNADIFYVATGTNVAVRTSSGGPINIYPIPGAGTIILGVVIDPANWQIAYAIDLTQVFKTVDAGVNWTTITGSLSDTNLRSIEAAPGELFVGGGRGVYTADMATPTAWSQYGAGLPHTPVWDLAYDDTDKVLIAGTLGRGSWLMPVTPSAAPLVYAAPSVESCGNNAPCLSVTNPVQNALTSVANNGTVRILGTNNIVAPLTSGNSGVNTVTVDSVSNGVLNGTLNFTGNGFDVGSGNMTIRGLNLSGATTVFNQTGGALTAYANNITGWTTAHNTSGGTAVLGNNWWDTASAAFNAADPGLPTGDWDKRLGADIGSWNIGVDTVALGSADLTVLGASGGTGTAVILSFGRASANAPFGNGIAPHVDNMCSDYYDFFVRNASRTWDVTVPVDDNANCNSNTRDTDRLFRITNIANCAVTDTQCWDRSGLAITHPVQNVVASGLTPAQLDGTHFVAGNNAGLDPTAVSFQSISASSSTPYQPILIAMLLLTVVGNLAWRRRS